MDPKLDATQPGVSATQPGALPDLNDPNTGMSRQDAMAVVRARRRQTAAQDMAPEDAKSYLEHAPEITAGAPVDMGGGADQDTDAGDAIAEAERKRLEAEAGKTEGEQQEHIDARTQVDAQRAEELILSDEDLSKYKVKVKVNGKEELRPLSDVRAGYQKVSAADQYLAEAKGLWTEAREQQARAPAPAEQTAAATPTELPAEVKTAAGEFVASIFRGDEEAMTSALVKVVSGRGNATPDNLTAQITRAVKLDLVKESALRQFRTDYKEIDSDPILRRVADTFLLEETGGVALDRLEPDQIPEVLERTGKRTTEWMKSIPGMQPIGARATTNRDERRAAKQTIDELPAAGTRAGSTVPPPKTVSGTIAEMAAARGHVLRSS